MSEAVKTPARKRKLYHRGRYYQIPIYLGKLLRGFVFQNDWKVLPMAAIIAGMVSMVVRGGFFVNMEGTLKGAFALTCVAIWNGCFNSIQVICRERSIVKREHRSGMHISSYVLSHMIYQALLCALQTGLTLYVCRLMKVQFPSKGIITPYFMLDMTLTVFFITYASDMLSLLVSSIAHTTTAAMTVMPFLLIFQLVFSGGFFSLPSWSKPLTNVTLSNYGLKCIAAQADYNHLPMSMAWNTLTKVSDEDIHVHITVGQVVDFLQQDDNELVRDLRSETFENGLTVGEWIDMMAQEDFIVKNREQDYDDHFTLRQIIDTIGRERVKEAVTAKATHASYIADYELTQENVISCWLSIIMLGLICAAASVIVLEFIDKDKR